VSPARLRPAALLLAAVALAGCARHADRELEVRVRRVVMDPATHAPVVLLEDPATNVALPIWIGVAEAQAIAGQLSGEVPQRPRIHDLVKTMFDRVGVALRRVVIRDLREGTYFADVVLERDGEELTVDSRPSDAIALALRCGQPIFVSRQLFAREGVVQIRDAGIDEVVTIAGVTVQGLSRDLAQYFRLPPGRGVLVSDVAAGREAALHRGDVVLELDGAPVRDVGDFRARLGAGSGAATLRVQRDGVLVDVALERDRVLDD
jgi:bifunctional DNase/RNase